MTYRACPCYRTPSERTLVGGVPKPPETCGYIGLSPQALKIGRMIDIECKMMPIIFFPPENPSEDVRKLTGGSERHARALIGACNRQGNFRNGKTPSDRILRPQKIK